MDGQAVAPGVDFYAGLVLGVALSIGLAAVVVVWRWGRARGWQIGIGRLVAVALASAVVWSVVRAFLVGGGR